MVLFPAPKFSALSATGTLLVGGLLYTYIAGSTTPLATYTDAGGGTANANPVVLDARGEANVWFDGSKLYKLVLKTAADVTIYTVDNVGFIAEGMSVRVFDFMTEAQRADVSNYTGAIDVTDACYAASVRLSAMGGGTLIYPPGRYRVFTSGSTSNTDLGTFSALAGSVAVLGHGAIIQLNRAFTTAFGYIFRFYAINGITVDGFRVDTNNVPDITATAVKSVHFVGLFEGCKNVSMPWNSVRGCLTGLSCNRETSDPESYRSQNIDIGVLEVRNGWYGVNLQNSGDNIRIGMLRTNTIHRSLLMYNLRGVRANVHSANSYSNDVYISQAPGMVAQDIDINYRMGTDSIAGSDSSSKVALNLVGAAGAGGYTIVRGLKVHFDIEYPTYDIATQSGAAAFKVTKAAPSTGLPDAVDRGHIVENVEISGRIKGRGHDSSPVLWIDDTCTWGAGEFFRNWKVRDLTLEDTLDVGFGTLAPIQDHITFDNVDTLTGNVEVLLGVPTGKVVMMPNCAIYNLHTPQSGDAILNVQYATSTAIPVGIQGRTVVNRNAGGAVEYDLPASLPGMEFKFRQIVNQDIGLDPSGSEVIRGGGAGKYLLMETLGSFVHLKCYVAGTWEIEASYGTISYEP